MVGIDPPEVLLPILETSKLGLSFLLVWNMPIQDYMPATFTTGVANAVVVDCIRLT